MADERRILICASERHLLRLVKVNLDRQGYWTESVQCGADALEVLERSKFALVVVAGTLSDMTGHDLREWIESHPDFRHVKVLLTGEANSSGPFITRGPD